MNEYLRQFRVVCGGRWHDYEHRDRLVVEYAWAVPTDEAIAAIAALSPIVEVGAGTGYWAMLLQQAGADVVAYDIAEPNGGFVNQYRHKKAWFPVQHGGHEVLADHADRTLFLCWPPYDDRMACYCLDTYRRAGGQRFAYVGESGGGCTGDRAFFSHLYSGWEQEQAIDLPQWNGIHDYLTIYRRKARAPAK